MSKKKTSLVIKVIIIGSVLFFSMGLINIFTMGKSTPKASKNSILALDLKGILLNKDKFLKQLREYSESDKIKGVLIRLDSPGGDVATSQEIYHEFKRIHKELNKPIVISVGSTMASGALYAAVGASKVFVNSGSLVGSIGVIWHLVNLEQLYDWAKVEHYTVKTGEFKEMGTKTRPMTANERELVQGLMSDLLEQFKTAIMDGRGMTPEELEPYTDARVFTGEVAVSAGFADFIGTYSDAIKEIGKLSGLGDKPILFTPQPSYFDRLSSKFEASLDDSSVNVQGHFQRWIYSLLKENIFPILRFHSNAQPLYIFPPAIGI